MVIEKFGNKMFTKYLIIVGVSFIILGTAIVFNKWVDNLFLSFLSLWKGKPPIPLWLDKLHLLGVDILSTGILIVVIGRLVLSEWPKLVALKQNKYVSLMVPIGEVLLIWLLMIVNEFSFSYIENEGDILPLARQFFEHNWLPNDWYLNLDFGYRHLFNLTFGFLVPWLGFEYGVYIGRLLIYLILAIAIYIFFKTLRLRFSFGILVLLLFLNHQSLIAGEWIVGGFETKTISYAFVILSLSFFFRKRYLMGFAFAGAAISFHIIVGCYALFCIAVATVLNKAWRSEWRLYIYHTWPFFITGYFGLQAIIEQLFLQSDVDPRVWEIYIQFRVPHHVLPAAWDGNLWIGELVLATGLFLILYFIGKSNATRFVAAYALGSVSLFLFGLAIYIWGEMNLLRFYWFRFPDVMVPFMSAVLITLFLNDIGDGRRIIRVLPHRFLSEIQIILRRVIPVILISATMVIVFQSLYQLQTEFKYSRQHNTTPRLSALEWISENTPKQAIFLVDPTMPDFYIYAQRAQLVSWKHLPDSAADILEWYERIKLSNGNRSPDKNGYDSLEELSSNFYHLDEDQIWQIANLYGINYYLGLPDQQLTFEQVYSNLDFTVYKVDDIR
jgi:hypothetical protein